MAIPLDIQSTMKQLRLTQLSKALSTYIPLPLDELDKAVFWQRPFILLCYIQAIYLDVFGIFNFSRAADEEAIEAAALNHCDSFREHLGCCIGMLKHYLSACRKVRWSHRLLTFPFAFWLLFSTLIFRLTLPKFFLRRWNMSCGEAFAAMKDPRRVRDLALDIRPIILSCLVANPLCALVFMINHASNSLWRSIRKSDLEGTEVEGYECMRIKQFVSPEDKCKNINFFTSPSFVLVFLSVFLLGIPGQITNWIYFHSNVDAQLGFPSHAPLFKQEIQQIQFYLMPLACCLSALFFRSYFTFILNFISRENDIEIYEDVIKSLPIKGWFRDFAILRAEHVPFQIEWKNVQSISYHSMELPAEKLVNVPEFFRPIQQVLELTESISKKLELSSTLLEIKDNERSLNIRLAELSKEQKAQLFFCIRKYAPSIYLNESVQEALIGSAVLREAKYTEIWFDVFNSERLDSVPQLKSGDSLRNGKYKIVDALGSGGQAVVYKAINTEGQTVVLKQYQLVPGESLEVMIESARAFETESTLLSQLNNKNIVRLNELFYEQSRVYLVLEHVEGKTLRELINESGHISEAKALELSLQLCDILSYLHEQQIVHRDFTPDNIILQPSGELKLIDFSVAQSERNLRRGECAGKHSYSPPEQFRAEAVAQSDIYALAASLFFLSTGNDPEPINVSSPRKFNKELSERFNKIVERGTALELENRYESADLLKADLLALINESTGTVALESSTGSAPTSQSAAPVKLFTKEVEHFIEERQEI
ncbi:MAG: serine/threonine protein kinase [Candidatus Obscuribacterales bacterium]|nr:serine/threonine protein kinase [Candidatus Obscuribacterales bacterium]